MTISRTEQRRQSIRRARNVAIVGSVLAHGLLLVLALPHWVAKLTEDPLPAPPEREALQIEATWEDSPDPPPPQPSEQPVAQPEPLPEPKPEPRVQRFAEVATTVTPQPAPAPAPPEPPQAVDPVPVEETPPPRSPVILEPEPADPKRILIPTAAAYDQVFASRDADRAARAKELSKGRRLMPNYEKTQAAIGTSLKSFGHAVKPGNHAGVNRKSSAFGSYIGVIHHKIHERWAHSYLMELDLHEPAGSPMNDPSLNTMLEFVIRADDGEVEAVNIVRSSGQMRFDAQAVAIAHGIGPHPEAPPELVSPDGRVYVHWNFWRDQRQCGTFGASVFIVSERGGSPG